MYAVKSQQKENLFFPYMEKYEINAPPKEMWGVDDEIREQIKEATKLASDDKTEITGLIEFIDEMMTKVSEMIFKEENIMIPMLLEHLKEEDWNTISEGMPEIGYIIDEVPAWKGYSIMDRTMQENEVTSEIQKEGIIKIPSGEIR